MKEIQAAMTVDGDLPPILQSARLIGNVRGLVASMSVEHCYRNASDEELEVNYTFPMPPTAVLMDISLTLNGKTLKGVVKLKDEANDDYDTAIEDGDVAVLVERSGPGLFTATLGNLLPGEEARITYQWVMPIDVRGGQASLSIPTAIKNRYGNALTDGRLSAHQLTFQDALVEYPFTIDISFDEVVSKGRISCPNHESASVYLDDTHRVTTKRLVVNDGAFLDRNLLIQIDNLPPIQSCSAIAMGKEVYLHATLPVPATDKCEKPSLAVKILIDCSGSMQDEDAIGQAKKAAEVFLQQLGPADFASVSSFGSKAFHPNTEMSRMTKEGLMQSLSEVRRLSANLGGTELEKALIETIRKIKPPAESDVANCCVLLITDGASWSHRKIIRSAIKAGHRIFCIGVGDNPAESLLYELSIFTRADYALASQGSSLQRLVSDMLSRMQEVSALTAEFHCGDLTPLWSSLDRPVANYANEQHHIFARLELSSGDEVLSDSQAFSNRLPSIHVSYRTNDGEKVHSEASVPLTLSSDPFLARWVAAQEVMSATELQARELALKHQLVTEQTSLIIVHERELAEKALGNPRSVAVAQMHSGAPSSAMLSWAPSLRVAECMSAIGDQSSVVYRSEAYTSRAYEVLRQESYEHLEIPAFLRKQSSGAVDESSQELSSVPNQDQSAILRILRAFSGGASLSNEVYSTKPTAVNAQFPTPDRSPARLLLTFNSLDLESLGFESSLYQLIKKVFVPEDILGELSKHRTLPMPVYLAVFVLVINQILNQRSAGLTTAAEEFLKIGLKEQADDLEIQKAQAEIYELVRDLTPLQWSKA